MTETTALIAWGAFFFKVKSKGGREKWELIDDDELKKLPHPRRAIIGQQSEPYADDGAAAVVTLTEKATGVVRVLHFAGANHALLTGLRPDTTYEYRVEINGKEWGGGPLRDWKGDGERGGMVLSGASYRNEFRTFPDPSLPSPAVVFAVLGDPGRGVHRDGDGGCCQGAVAEALKVAVDNRDVRFILTTGDNIYRSRSSGQGSGHEDDDWFFSYFQPYRYVINRIPVFPAVGNHDDGESFGESSDDRDQLYDNLYLKHAHRFADFSIGPGLFYRFRYGADIELISLDTSKRRRFFAERYFRHANHKGFLDAAFPAGPAAIWRIPYFHHPPYCAGPNHSNRDSVIEHLAPRFGGAGVRAVFCGHEHNFQHALDGEVHYFVTGGAGKFETDPPSTRRFSEAKTQAWGGNDEGHFLLVEIDGDRLTVAPIGELVAGAMRPIRVNAVGGGNVTLPVVIQR